MILLLYSRSSHASEEQSGPGQGHWSYKDWQEWNLHYPDCGGMMQSPININTAKTIFSPQLRPIQLSGYSLPSKERLKLKNNGHTVVLKLPESLAITGGYAQQYRAVQLHLHWGSLTGPGSEHTINNHRFPAEIHVVHYNTKYDNFEEAMVHPDGLAVLGAFLQVGPRENPYYRQILEHLYTIQGEGEEVLVPGFNIAGLLPANLNLYFHYNGSLTTPACYQTVKWTIFNQTVQLSQDQISVLVTTLRGDDDSPLQNNFRRLQELHGRHVLASFQTALTSVKQLPPGGDSSSEAGAEKHTSSFQAGDVLAVLFGVLFAVTALAFLLYIHKHRNQNARLDSPTKSKVIYTAATTDENAV
ncbi:carbonic anhydrase 9-like isoform X4 [Struthio camelus]|uniref:carbonic anhydrase 9-like isoform X4 n=1 Tax=Struthio camelus TaxID=8801 RepID=UPI00051E64B2|nr:PREDICTED: carbonic anhydrase 9 isoform X2 [Struthio camelus australis]